MIRTAKTLTLALAVALVGVALTAGSAAAHPLGNFTVNHLTEVRISSDRIDLRYILDQAEVPTFQARRETREARLEQVRAELRRNLQVTVDGRPAGIEVQPGATLEPRPGEGGLKTTRIEFRLAAATQGGRRVVVRDETYGDRAGWKAIVARPGDGTRVESSVSSASDDVTNGLRSYPKASLSAPLDQRTATFTVEPGDGELVAPGASGRPVTTQGAGREDGFSALFASAAAGEGVLLFLMLAAFGWGALHALSPGHGKAMVAAYLVGTRGTSRDAVALGAVVTVTHTIGVFALGLVTLLLAQYILPDDLYPWLNVTSGLLVVVIGGAILWSRIQVARGRRASALGEHRHDGHDHHHHHHGHDHDHGHHHGHGHGHHHHHHHGEGVSRKGILGMGASAGLIPCPSALVVLLGAVSQQQVVLGMALIATFSVGLAATLTALGLVVVRAGSVASRLNLPSVLTRGLPAASALVIVVLGAVLTGRALPGVV